MVMRPIIGLLGFILVVALAATLAGRVAPSTRVYTVGEVQAGLRLRQGAWAGRTVTVRGWISGGGGMNCAAPVETSCRVRWVRLASDATPNGLAPEVDVTLPRGVRAESLYSAGFGALLARLPLVGPGLFRWSGSKTVRVRLLATSPTCAGTLAPCAGGALVP